MAEKETHSIFKLSEGRDGISFEYEGTPAEAASIAYVKMVEDGGGELLQIVATSLAMYLATFPEEDSASMLQDMRMLVGVLRDQNKEKTEES